MNIRFFDNQKRWEMLEKHLEETGVFTTADLKNQDLVLCAYLRSYGDGKGEGISQSYTFLGDTDEFFDKSSVPFRIRTISFAPGVVVLHVVGKESNRKTKKWTQEFADITSIDLNAIRMRWSDEH